MRIRSIIFAAAVLLFIPSCGRRDAGSSPSLGREGEGLYSALLTITRADGYTLASIADPWHDGRELHRYVLIPKADTTTTSDLPRGTVVRVPIERAVVFTAAHAWLLCQLGQGSRMAGVCDLKYMNIPFVRQAVDEGRIIDCGDGMAADVERIVSADADALLLSPFENSGGYAGLEKIGIPIIECADYMERSPLARAEWMKFYGLLFGCEAEADSLFAEVEANYLRLCDHARSLGRGLSLLTERKTGATWYVPGGESTTGQLISDAAGWYLFGDDPHGGSLPLSPEQIMTRADSIDVWAIKTNGGRPLTKQELLSEYGGYVALKAFRDGRIYECDTQQVPFFEEVGFRPDWLLSDFIRLTHPHVGSADSLRYYRLVTR